MATHRIRVNPEQPFGTKQGLNEPLNPQEIHMAIQSLVTQAHIFCAAKNEEGFVWAEQEILFKQLLSGINEKIYKIYGFRIPSQMRIDCEYLEENNKTQVTIPTPEDIEVITKCVNEVRVHWLTRAHEEL